jgi:LysR family transcriptional regulator, low CO2-responsive transcriptional regulator
MRNVTLRQLKVFEAVARNLSFSRAAEELHLTQPAVSMQVKQLEQAAGLPLTEQIGKKISLTQAGAEMAALARDLSQRMRETDDALAAMQGLRGGLLTVAIVSSAKYSAPMLLAKFLQRYPGINLKLEVQNREAVWKLVEDNSADLAIAGRPPEGLAAFSKAFADNPHIIIAHPGHALANNKRIALARVVQEPFINREAGSGTRQAFERLLAQHKLGIQSALEASSNETIKQAVLAGMGVAFLSRQTVSFELQARRLVELNVEDLPVMRRWYLVHRADKRLSPAAAAFKTFLLSEGEGLMASIDGAPSNGKPKAATKARRRVA